MNIYKELRQYLEKSKILGKLSARYTYVNPLLSCDFTIRALYIQNDKLSANMDAHERSFFKNVLYYIFTLISRIYYTYIYHNLSNCNNEYNNIELFLVFKMTLTLFEHVFVYVGVHVNKQRSKIICEDRGINVKY